MWMWLRLRRVAGLVFRHRSCQSPAAPHSGLSTSLLLSASRVFLKWVSRCWREREGGKTKRAVEEEEEE